MTLIMFKNVVVIEKHAQMFQEPASSLFESLLEVLKSPSVVTSGVRQ